MKRHTVVLIVAGLLAVWGLSEEPDICQPALFQHGIALPSCPSGKVRQTASIDVSQLRRGAEGNVEFEATAYYTTSASDSVESAGVSQVQSLELSLIDAKGTATKVKTKGWRTRGGARRNARIVLPNVPDGDYKLRADYRTPLGTGALDVAIPLYTPARVHVITDRPLYEPGNTVRFRAVVLRAKDLSPIDGRPGIWIIKDPTGEVMLEEKAPAADWGVVAGTFPLDKGSPSGTWSVTWQSAEARQAATFTVEPFTLPRFRVDAAPSRPYYRPGETPAIRGAVVYSSGAPVAKAALEIAWQFAGDWPPPLEWEASLLPKKLVAGANGRFELALPQIPKDLQGRTTMTAYVSATDAAGDRVATAIPVLLTEDGIQVSSVTELGDGLVEGFNNRMYVRVTTPDGRVVPGAKIKVKRAWQDSDPGIDAVLDEDGVASLQIDPGGPVNIVIPPKPFRPAPRPPLVTRGAVEELIGGEGAPLADQVAMDTWLAALLPCAKWVGQAGAADDDASDGSGGIRIGFRVSAGGSIGAAGGGGTRLARCVVDIIRARRLPAGDERMYTVTFNFGDPDLPNLAASVESALETPDGLQERFGELAASTRDCLPTKGSEGALPLALTWSVRAGSKDIELGGWIKDPHGAPNTALACVQSRIAGRIALADKATHDALGLVRFSVQLPDRLEQQKPQATVMLGYELLVSAEIEGAPSTKLRVVPGAVPPLRLRVTPILAKPGDTVTAELIRGPNYNGKLPTELELKHLGLEKPMKAKLDDERKAAFVLDDKAEGWIEITGGGLRSLVYVKPQGELAVSVTPGKDRYAPGQMAELAIATKIGGKPGKAAVSLIGVDDSLGQLVSLPGPDSMSSVQPEVGTSSPAFGTLDGQALALGRIRGGNAAAATVLRVSTIPQPPELDAVVTTSARSQFDAVAELTDHFYVILDELHEQARTWEATAKAGEKMRPRTMARLWSKALDAVAKRGQPNDDAYGRRLRLSLLPPDLLSLVDPRAVIVVGTRLPEDVENWTAWVAKEKP
jgi:hypothetical protein